MTGAPQTMIEDNGRHVKGKPEEDPSNPQHLVVLRGSRRGTGSSRPGSSTGMTSSMAFGGLRRPERSDTIRQTGAGRGRPVRDSGPPTGKP